MDLITIGLCGLTFNSENKGCSALGFSFIEILAQSTNKEIKLIIFESRLSNGYLDNKYQNIKNIENIEYHFSDFNSHNFIKKKLKECHYVFDFTEGDSFTDIYGFKRLIANSYLKYLSIKYSEGLILGPQTCGPFNHKWCKKLGAKIIKRSLKVYTRDDLSTEYVKDIANRNVLTIIDVAFGLPYAKKIESKKDRIKIGINVSGLLWNNGYTGKNEFGLTVSYKTYIQNLLEEYSKKDKYEIHLIPHVICEDYNNVENDEKAIDELIMIYPNCIKSPIFDTPMEAKSYISQMDVFTGARMHSTIAAFSSGTAVIPFSYSRKFEGLYDTLKYPYCIHGKEMTTEIAVAKSIEYINNYTVLKKLVDKNMSIAEKKLSLFKKELQELLEKKGQ